MHIAWLQNVMVSHFVSGNAFLRDLWADVLPLPIEIFFGQLFDSFSW